MATTLSVNPILVQIGWNYSNTTNISGVSVGNNNRVTYSDTLADGTGADQAKAVYFADSGNLAEDDVWTLDLAGSLTNVFNQTITFAKIRLLYLQHQTATTTNGSGVVRNDCTVAGTFLTASTNNVITAAGSVYLRPGGFLCFYTPDTDGYGTVVNTSADTVTVTNNAATTVTVRGVVIGTT